MKMIIFGKALYEKFIQAVQPQEMFLTIKSKMYQL